MLLPDDPETLVTTSQAAELLSVDPSTIRQWSSRGYVSEWGNRVKLPPAGLAPARKQKMYRIIDVLRAERATRNRRKAA